MTRRTPVDVLLAGACILSETVGLWLAWVIVTVLPDRDPGAIPGWGLLTIAMQGLVVLTAADLFAGHRITVLRSVALVASVTALAVDGYVLVSASTATQYFEGYLVLIGGIVAVHGGILLLRQVSIQPERQAS